MKAPTLPALTQCRTTGSFNSLCAQTQRPAKERMRQAWTRKDQAWMCLDICRHVCMAEVKCMQWSFNWYPRGILGHRKGVSRWYSGVSGGIRIRVSKGYPGASGRGIRGVSGGIRGYPHNSAHEQCNNESICLIAKQAGKPV